MNERIFIVPHWIKIIFFWFAITLLVSLISFQIDKRQTFNQLLIANAVQPLPILQRPAPEMQSSLSQFSGKWVVLNFWATWCSSCRTEMPSLEMLARHLGDRAHVVTVSVDDSFDDVNRFFHSEKPAFALLWDKEKKISDLYGVTKFPETFLISPQGMLVAQISGARDFSSAASLQYFDELVAGKRNAF